MRKINTRLFVILLITAIVFAGAVFGLHRLQAGNIADALLWQAAQAEKEGKLDRAAKYLGRYLEFVRDDIDTRAHLGTLLADPQVATTPQRRARARFVIDQVLAKDPDRHDLRKRACEILIAGRSFEAAKEHLTYLERSQSSSASIALLSGQWHEAQGKISPAIEAYRRAVKLDANLTDAYVRLVTVLKQSDFGKEPQNAEEIEQLLVTALEKTPHDGAVLSLAAEQAQGKGKTRIALNYLEDGLKHNPAEPRLYLALARIQSEQGKRPEAITKLRLGLDAVRKENRHELRWTLANLLLDDNRMDDAQKVIGEIRETNVLSADYLQARAMMLRGRWFDAARQFDKIRPAVKGMKELSFQVDLYLGGCFEQLDEPMQQLAAYERASKLDPTSVAAMRGLANARSALGQTAEALEIHRELVLMAKEPNESAQRRLDYARLLLQSMSAQNSRDLTRVRNELDDIEKTLGKSLDVSLLRAEFLFLQGDKTAAENMLQELIKEHPNRHEPWIALLTLSGPGDVESLMQRALTRFKDKAEFRAAQIHFWSRHYDAGGSAALKTIEDDIGAFEPRPRSILLQALAETHYVAGKYDDSRRALTKLIALPMHAQDVRFHMQLLELAILQDDDEQARNVLDGIKKLEGDAAGGPDWSLGEAMRIINAARRNRKEDLEKARQLLTVAAAHRPNWHPIIQLRAEIDDLQGRSDQAIANYRLAIDLGSRDPLANKQLLYLLSQAQRHEEVEQVLARMQKQQGATGEVIKLFAQQAVVRHRWKDAEYLIKKIVTSDSKNYRDHLWMGQVLSIGGQSSEDAEKALRRAVALAPEQPETWIGLVRHLIGNGQHEDARKEIENASKALPANRKDGALAQCHELRGFLGDAADCHKAALENSSNPAAAHRAAAEFYQRVKRPAEAEVLYRKAYERKIPVSDEEANAARRGLAVALARQPRPGKAAEALKLVALQVDEQGLLKDAKFAEMPDELLLQAKVLGLLNHHKLREKAIGLLESLQKKNLLGPDDRFSLARLYVQHGGSAEWAKARILLKALVADQPKHVRYLTYAAQQHIQQKEYADAEPIIARLEAVERERKAMQGGFGSIELRAKIMEQRGLGLQAATLLSEYAKQPGASPSRKLLLAHLHGRLGNFRDAIDTCVELRQVESLQNEASAAAIAILRMNKPSEAQPTKYDQWVKERDRVESILREAMQKNPDVVVRLHLADLMELQGKYKDVELLCREVLAQFEDHLVALNNLAWLLGQKEQTANEALTLIDRAVNKYGPRPELLDTRAVAQLALGRIEPALRDLERVVNEAPTPTRLFHLCRAYERAKNLPSAQAALRQANEAGLTPQLLHPVEQAEYERVAAILSRRP